MAIARRTCRSSENFNIEAKPSLIFKLFHTHYNCNNYVFYHYLPYCDLISFIIKELIILEGVSIPNSKLFAVHGK